jgi:predicted enzyme related to lactoylglutathione lyase
MEGDDVDAIAQWNSVQVDCDDPVALATFWARIVGSAVEQTMGDPPHYVAVGPTAPGGPWLSFQRVSEAKVVKNRLHLDLVVDDLEAGTARIEELGGRRVSGGDFEEYGFVWRLMTDPEGNEFCLILS